MEGGFGVEDGGAGGDILMLVVSLIAWEMWERGQGED